MGEKISAMTELTSIPAGAELVGALNGRNVKIPVSELPSGIFLNRFTGGAYKDEFFNVNAFRTPWEAFAVGAGTLTALTGIADHPGIARITQSGANTGYRIHLPGSELQILLAGSETTELIFRVSTTTNLVMYFGFGDDFTNAAGGPFADGVFINIAGTTLDGRTRNNSSGSTTSTNYTITTSTWYHLKIVINSDGTRVDFYVLDSAGATLWTDFLTTNIPLTRTTSHGVRATKTTVGTSVLIDLDFMNLVFGNQLTR